MLIFLIASGPCLGLVSVKQKGLGSNQFHQLKANRCQFVSLSVLKISQIRSAD